jgi:hypothetical protein
MKKKRKEKKRKGGIEAQKFTSSSTCDPVRMRKYQFHRRRGLAESISRSILAFSATVNFANLSNPFVLQNGHAAIFLTARVRTSGLSNLARGELASVAFSLFEWPENHATKGLPGAFA